MSLLVLKHSCLSGRHSALKIEFLEKLNSNLLYLDLNIYDISYMELIKIFLVLSFFQVSLPYF